MPMMPRRPAAVVLIAASAVTALAACGNPSARLTFHDTEKVKITEIVMAGGAGDVTVKTSAIEETRITRIVRSSSDPEQSYRIDGTTLHIDTDCGPDCLSSYEIEAPAGVAVRGELTSGDVALTGIGAADFTLTSGNVLIRGASDLVKVRATSGDVDVYDAAKGVDLEVSSGNLRAMDVTGPVTADASSGDIDVKLAAPASVTASAQSGNVDVVVPEGSYRVRADARSGDEQIAGVDNDPASKNLLDVSAGSGDVRIAVAGA